jgi:hypothetical protein
MYVADKKMNFYWELGHRSEPRNVFMVTGIRARMGGNIFCDS